MVSCHVWNQATWSHVIINLFIAIKNYFHKYLIKIQYRYGLTLKEYVKLCKEVSGLQIICSKCNPGISGSWFLHVIELAALRPFDWFSVKEKSKEEIVLLLPSQPLLSIRSKALQHCNSFSSGLISLPHRKLLLAKISCQFLPLGDKKCLSCLNPLPQSIIWSLRSSHDIWHSQRRKAVKSGTERHASL